MVPVARAKRSSAESETGVSRSSAASVAGCNVGTVGWVSGAGSSSVVSVIGVRRSPPVSAGPAMTSSAASVAGATSRRRSVSRRHAALRHPRAAARLGLGRLRSRCCQVIGSHRRPGRRLVSSTADRRELVSRAPTARLADLVQHRSGRRRRGGVRGRGGGLDGGGELPWWVKGVLSAVGSAAEGAG